MKRLLLFHTAFPGDIILTLPLLQALRRHLPESRITTVTTPAAAEVLQHHPAVDERLLYDKRGEQKSLRAALHLARELRTRAFDAALIPHRSLRSALVCRRADIPRRIGFATSAGRWLLTDTVPDDRQAHEIARNLALLRPLGVPADGAELPDLFPGAAEREAVERFFRDRPQLGTARLAAVAPGSVWNTKRWPADRFTALLRLLAGRGFSIVLVGGESDRPLCAEIAAAAGEDVPVADASGRFTLLGSAELLRRCRICVSNDSAPMHLAVAVRTPVVAVFGPTVPAFGFGPAGRGDRVVGVEGLTCRPCSIHGGARCPTGTFACMLGIPPEQVLEDIMIRLG